LLPNPLNHFRDSRPLALELTANHSGDSRRRDLAALGIVFVTLGEGIDTTSLTARLLLRVLGPLSESERCLSKSASGEASRGESARRATGATTAARRFLAARGGGGVAQARSGGAAWHPEINVERFMAQRDCAGVSVLVDPVE
jgi:hypothetical protein